MAENGWFTRKRKHVVEATTVEEEGGSDGASSMPADNEKKESFPVASNSSSKSAIPESLLPFLGWTKLSACHRRPTKKRKHTNWDRDEALQKVTGRAIVSILCCNSLSIGCRGIWFLHSPSYCFWLYYDACLSPQHMPCWDSNTRS